VIHVIINPRAAAGRAARTWQRVEAQVRARHEIRVHGTESGGDGVRLAAEAVRAAATAIVVVGGDGSLHEVVNGLLGALDGTPGPTLILWPSGSGNDFARSLGVRPSWDGLRAGLYGSTTRQVDAWQARWPGGTRWFINAASFGLTARAVALATWPGVRVTAGRYVAGAIRSVWRGADYEVRLSLDQAPLAAQRLAAGVLANGAWFGAGMPIAPGAALGDGQLDLVLACATTRPRLLGLLARVVAGRHCTSPLVSRRSVSSLTLEWRGELPFEMDGETVQVASPLEVRCAHGALRFAVPPPSQTTERVRREGGHSSSLPRSDTGSDQVEPS